MRIPPLHMPRTARVPAIALGCLVLFLFLGMQAASEATAHQGSNFDADPSAPRRYAGVTTVWDASPGDQVDLYVVTTDSWKAAVPYLRVLVVEGGEGDAIQAGGSARHVHLDARFEDVAKTVDSHGFESYTFAKRLTRPGIYDGKPEGQLHDSLDVVLLADRPAWMGDPQWQQVERAAGQAQLSVIVARQPWVALQSVWAVGMVASGAVAVVGFIGFARRRDAQAPEPPGGPLADLVGLHAKAAGFLRSLRNTMRVSGAILALGGAAGLVALNSGFGLFSEAPGYAPFGESTIGGTPTDHCLFLLMGLGFLTYFLALGLWFVQYRRIASEHRRWASTPSPLDE